jgi:uncharacterized protein YjbI with pentapeptide repeats
MGDGDQREHLIALLKKGVGEFNQFRRDHPHEPIDLMFLRIRQDLSEADLTGVDLHEADLSGADLLEACLIRADLSGATLAKVVLCGANLTGANLRGANLAGADLSCALLRRADLSATNLQCVDLRLSELSGATFVDARNLCTVCLGRAKDLPRSLRRNYLRELQESWKW